MKYEISYGKYTSVIRGNLVKSVEQFEKLKVVYIDMYKIFEKIENSTNRIEMYNLNKDIESLEFKMQEIFGFPVTSNYHRWWFESPKCTCPKMDNTDDLGTGIRHINLDCIIHGTKTRKSVERKEKLKKIKKLEKIENIERIKNEK